MILGLDIGGANLKLATTSGIARSRSFPLWQRPDDLGQELRQFAADLPSSAVAVTMSGELADGYASRQHGVAAIVESVQRAFASHPVVFWQTAGEFVSAADATEFWPLTAASNWHALATYASRSVGEQGGLLIDCGTTTTDLIRLGPSVVLAEGLTDVERLASGELAYTGVGRTPAAMLVDRCCVELADGRSLPVRPAAELFATSGDAWTVAASDRTNWSGPTADGRSTSNADCRRRLARQFCCDIGDLADAASGIAQQLVDAQVTAVCKAAKQLLGNIEPKVIVLAGSGRVLAEAVVMQIAPEATVLDLAELLTAAQSDAACAFAVATLATERLPQFAPNE